MRIVDRTRDDNGFAGAQGPVQRAWNGGELELEPANVEDRARAEGKPERSTTNAGDPGTDRENRKNWATDGHG